MKIENIKNNCLYYISTFNPKTDSYVIIKRHIKQYGGDLVMFDNGYITNIHNCFTNLQDAIKNCGKYKNINIEAE